VPAFAALNETRSYTAGEIRKLQKCARFFPHQLEVNFCDGKSRHYYVILGTIAFQVCAEIPFYALQKDRRITQLADESPFIC
jgi:hypothetical protein